MTSIAPDEPPAQELIVSRSPEKRGADCPSYASLEEACMTVRCRPPRTVRVREKDGVVTESSLPGHPIVQCGFFNVYAGETVYVEADETPSGPVRLRAVDGPGPGTMSFTLSQGRDDQMVLRASSRLSRPLKFQLHWMDMEGQVRNTSSCPIWPGKTNHELWPHPIFQLIVEDLRFPEDDQQLVCD
jgi:hypothetical protein